ncbi:MAG: hypothetical protein IKX31_03575 [Muribaculaceae bacterium]|nr:hypothetical protein [Muribaculaceae bacterium]
MRAFRLAEIFRLVTSRRRSSGELMPSSHDDTEAQPRVSVWREAKYVAVSNGNHYQYTDSHILRFQSILRAGGLMMNYQPITVS